jgi:hypothetical protein
MIEFDEELCDNYELLYIYLNVHKQIIIAEIINFSILLIDLKDIIKPNQLA